MEQAEYGAPEAPDAPVASLRIPGDTRVLLVALVLTILGLPIIAVDTFGAGGDGSESIVVEAAAASSDTTSTTEAAGPPKVIQVLSDGDERIEEAYERTRAAQRASDDDVTTTTEADESPATTEPEPEPTTPPTTKAPAPKPAPAPAAPVGDVWGRLAYCESGGNWAHQGSYHGGLQFHPSTWSAYGGTQYATYAYQASASEQIAIAQKIVASQGGTYKAWPGCRAKLGLP